MATKPDDHKGVPYHGPQGSSDWDFERFLPSLHGDRFYLQSSQQDFIDLLSNRGSKDESTEKKSGPAEMIVVAKRAMEKGELRIAERLFVKAMRTSILDNSSKKSPEPYFHLAEILEKKAEEKELELVQKQRYLLQAAALYNFVRNYLESSDTDVELSRKLSKLVCRKLLDIQDSMITICGGNPPQGGFDAERKKNELKRLRNEVSESLESLKCIGSSSNQAGQLNESEVRQKFKDQTAEVKRLSGTVSERMKQFLASIIDECLALLGTPSYDYEVIVFGSLARNEATPYSDFEWAILTSSEEEECKVFFRNLTNVVHLQVINLGETILPSMNIDAINGEWFYDDVTPRGVSLDGLLPQACKIPLGNMKDFELIHTPEKMAEFQSNEWYEKNWSLADTIMTFSPLRSEKSTMVEAYRNEIDKVLSTPCYSESCQHDASSDAWPTRGSCRGLRVLQQDLSRYWDMMTGNNDLDEGKFYDVKKEIYRLPDRVITALAKCCEVKSAGIFAILDELYEKEVISSEARDNLASASAIAIRLRLSTYLKAGKQGEQLNPNSNEKTEKKSPIYHMPTDEELFHFFFVAIPLYDELRQFKTSGNIPSSFASNSFFDDSDVTKGQIYCRLLNYDKAIECYERAVRENPENLSAEIRRIRVALFAAHNLEQLGKIRKNLDNLLGKIVENFCLLDTNVNEATLEFTPLMNTLDMEECRQLVEGLLYVDDIYGSPDYFAVAKKILFQFFFTSNNSESKESAILGLALLKKCTEFSQNKIEAVVFKSTLFIGEEGISTRSIVLLNSLGEFLFYRRKLGKAYRCFQRALSMEHLLFGTRPNVNVMASLFFLGVIARELYMHPESRFYLESLVHLLKSVDGIKPRLLLKETYLELSFLMVEMDYNPNKTLHCLKTGLEVTTGTTNERELVLNCLLSCKLAILHFQQNPEQACKAILDAQTCLRNCTDIETRDKMVLDVARTLCEMKKSQEGIELLKEELKKFTLDSQAHERAFYFKALGKLCLKQDLAEAKNYYLQAMDNLASKKSEDYLECLIGLSKAVIMEGDVSEAKEYLDNAFTSAMKLPASDKKSSVLLDIADICELENISEIALARQCYDEALKTYKEESNISKKPPLELVYLEITLGHLTKKMLSVDLVERIHYDRASVILRQHVETGQVDSRTVLMFQALAEEYRSIDRKEEIRLLLESLEVSELVYGSDRSQEMVGTVLAELSCAYFKSGDVQSSMKYRERQIEIELQLYSSNPFNEHITNTLMTWAVTSFNVPISNDSNDSNDSIERAREFFLSSLNDKALLPKTAVAKTIAAKCFTFIAVLFYTSNDFEKAKSLNEKASQLFGEVQESVENERDPCRETCDLLKTIFSSENILPSHRKDLETLVLKAGIPYPDIFTQENSVAGDKKLNKELKKQGRNTLVVEQSTFSPLSIIHLLLDALEYYKSKGDFLRAAEIHSFLQLQIRFYKNSPLDCEELISEAIEAKNKNQPYKSIRLLDLALKLQLPGDQCNRTPKILKLRGECFLSMGHFRSAAIDFAKADALYFTKTIDNREDLCEYSEVLIGLIKSKILCNNVEAAWLICERAIKLAFDHEIKETINKQVLKLCYLGMKCFTVFLEQLGCKDDEKNMLDMASYSFQEALSLRDLSKEVVASDFAEKVSDSVLTENVGVLKMKCEVILLWENIFPASQHKDEEKDLFLETKADFMHFTETMPTVCGHKINYPPTDLMGKVSADDMRNAEPKEVLNTGINCSLKARLLIQSGDIEQSINWLFASLATFFSVPLPDFMWYFEEFLPLLQAITATKSSAPDQRRSPFQQAVDMCKRTLINQNESSSYVNQFLTTLIIIYRSLGQAQEAMVVAEIGLEMSDLMCYSNDSDKLNNRCRMLLHLAQIHQQNSSNPAFKNDEEFNLAERYYLSDRDRKENMVLCKDLSYANFLCETNRFARAVAVLEDMRNLGRQLRNKYVYIEYFSCAFYGAGVEKSVKIDGELLTTVKDILYNLLVRAYVGIRKRKEAVATCEILTVDIAPDIHEPVYGKRPSCKPYLVEDCHRELLSLLNEEDRHQFQNCNFPLSSTNLAKLYYILGEYEMAVKYFPKDAESPEMLEMKISCLRLAGNELIDSNRGDESLSFFQQFLEMFQVKEGFLDKSFNNQCEILQTYYFANQYYVFYSLGIMHVKKENIDAAIQCFERCIELDEDFTCGQDIVATLSELYQTKALTVDFDNEDSRKVYIYLAWKLFQKLFQKTVEMNAFVERSFASLLTRLDRHEEAVGHFYKVIERSHYNSFVTFVNVDKPLVDVYLLREIEALGGSVVIPIKVQAAYELILTLMKLKQIQIAQKVAFFLENVVKRTPWVPVNGFICHSLAGYAYKIIGNKEKAKEIFVSVLEKNPGHLPVAEALESCGDLKKGDHHDRRCPDVVDQCESAPVICGNEGCGMIVNESEKENHEKNFCKFRIAEDETPKASQNEIEASKKIQYYGFLSMGLKHYKMENIDAAIQCFERCIELDEDFTCGQDIVATLSKLYQTKALTVNLDNEDSRKIYMDLAWKLFQKLFQKTVELTTFVELSFALLLKRLDRYEEAVEHFHKVIERANRKSFVTYGNVDKPLVDSNLRREIEALDGSVDVPIKVLAVYELILTLMKLHRVEKAQKFALILESVVEEYNLEIDVKLTAYSMAGYAYKITGNKEKAKEIFVLVLKNKPGHPPLTEALGSLN